MKVAHDALAEEWVAPGRKTVQGYLVATRGPLKRDYGLFGNLVAGALEQDGKVRLPRYQDLHSVWFDWDPEGKPNYQAIGPFLRYKATRPIPGLATECRGHRVEVTCTVGARTSNRLAAYITRAEGRCLTCADGAA